MMAVVKLEVAALAVAVQGVGIQEGEGLAAGAKVVEG